MDLAVQDLWMLVSGECRERQQPKSIAIRLGIGVFTASLCVTNGCHMPYITLTPDNIQSEHICCAFSDKKCAESYASKKEWLAHEFNNGYVFRRLDERAKVFIEYGPAETGCPSLLLNT